jgi:hypothetical protein
VPSIHDRLSWLATVATVAMMFAVLTWAQPFIASLRTSYAIASGGGAIVASLGVYRLIADALRWSLRKVLWLRKLVLGRQFLEGTWVGHYLSNGEHRFTIEFIDQAGTVPILHGREVDAQGDTLASWASDTMSIDIDRRLVLYSYTCRVFRRKHVHEGLGVFTIVCEEPGQAAMKLDGYAVDLVDGNRDPNTEYKIADTAVSDSWALERAQEIFKVSPASL